jgi:hypothetical protein
VKGLTNAEIKDIDQDTIKEAVNEQSYFFKKLLS